MQNLTVVRLIDNQLAWYPPGAGIEPRLLDNPEALAAFTATLAAGNQQGCFAAPGADVRLLQLQVTPEEKQHISKALPFLLEEQVAEDIEQLHFAACPLGKDNFGVALCRHQLMAAWETQLSGLPPLPRWLPEPLLLPWRAGEWCIVLESRQAIVRTGECQGYTIEHALLPTLLAASVRDPEAPQSLVIYGSDQTADLALVPDELKGRVQWRRGNLCSALMLARDDHPLNLRQGEYAARLPLSRWWREWRLVAGVFALAIGMQLASTWAEYRTLAQENLALRTAVEARYREAVPDGALVDAERQLQRQVDVLSGSASGGGFVPLLEKAGAIIVERPGTAIVSINYTQRGDEMRLNILAEDFASVEQLRSGLAAAGLDAAMESSSAQGERVRARIRVGRS
ncbi:type II secretion system protein GspL [Kineobactrum sediminis]|uniref:Type II secretion system protein L n=1 Tax=Kineobactrum sediminis TaxID=1905677 RepID=A0A2N5Y0K5_9GAMM|nr:type II secretion system protein GspL [Kineobactrum sediminis]PLW81934.1 type II secretion system protein GspL [Kineobactrum sediminis]